MNVIIDERGRVFVPGFLDLSIRSGGATGQSGLLIDSMEAARALAHAILDADRDSLDAKPLARIEIIDVSAHARELYGQEGADKLAEILERPLPEHDYRFQGIDPVTERKWSAGVQYTAEHVMASILEDRRLPEAGL